MFEGDNSTPTKARGGTWRIQYRSFLRLRGSASVGRLGNPKDASECLAAGHEGGCTCSRGTPPEAEIEGSRKPPDTPDRHGSRQTHGKGSQAQPPENYIFGDFGLGWPEGRRYGGSAATPLTQSPGYVRGYRHSYLRTPLPLSFLISMPPRDRHADMNSWPPPLVPASPLAGLEAEGLGHHQDAGGPKGCVFGC